LYYIPHEFQHLDGPLLSLRVIDGHPQEIEAGLIHADHPDGGKGGETAGGATPRTIGKHATISTSNPDDDF